MKIRTSETVFHYKTEDVHVQFTKSTGEEVDKWITKPVRIAGLSHVNEIKVVLEGVKIGRAGTKVHFAYVFPNTKIVDGVLETDERFTTVCGTETFKARMTVAYGEATISDITCEKCLKKLGVMIENDRIIE